MSFTKTDVGLIITTKAVKDLASLELPAMSSDGNSTVK